MTTIANTRRLDSAENGLFIVSWLIMCWWCTNRTPATAARKPEIAKPASIVRSALMPYASAARGFSRNAINTRPVRLRRIPYAIAIANARTDNVRK